MKKFVCEMCQSKVVEVERGIEGSYYCPECKKSYEEWLDKRKEVCNCGQEATWNGYCDCCLDNPE